MTCQFGVVLMPPPFSVHALSVSLSPPIPSLACCYSVVPLLHFLVVILRNLVVMVMAMVMQYDGPTDLAQLSFTQVHVAKKSEYEEYRVFG